MISSKSSKMTFGRRANKNDDVVELLATGRSSAAPPPISVTTRPNGASGSGQGYRGTGLRDPPKDIFDDL